MNKKGMTLIELIIAVGLISIVMVFLYSLLSDLNNEITNGDFAINNQIKRFEIINTIQNDILNETISSIQEEEGSGGNSYNIYINYESGKVTTITLKYISDSLTPTDTENDSIKVTEKDGTITTWIIDNDAFLGTAIDVKENSSYAYNIETFYINIPIYTTNESNSSTNNNVLDDITIYYVND